jgi:hypothetical protein
MDPFAHELYNQISVLKKIDPQKLANHIGTSVDTIYRYDRNDIKTPLFRARQIVVATEEIALARAMLDGTPFIPVERPNGEIAPGTIDKDQIIVLLAAADAVKTIQTALDDGRISVAEGELISKALDGLLSKITALRLKIEKIK